MTSDELKAISEIAKQVINNPCPFVKSYWIDLKKHLASEVEAFK